MEPSPSSVVSAVTISVTVTRLFRKAVMNLIFINAVWLLTMLTLIILVNRCLNADKEIKALLSLILLIIAVYVSYSNYISARENKKNQFSGLNNTPTPELLIFEKSPTPIGGDIYITMTAAAAAFTIPTFPSTPDQAGVENRFTYRLPFEGTFPISQNYSELSWEMTPAHTGIDYACPPGTEILASASGVVMAAAFDPDGYGFHVIIQHADGLATLYAHLDSFNVKINQTVYKGDVIGISGDTGNTTGPHLHFETRRKWNDESSCFNPALLPFD